MAVAAGITADKTVDLVRERLAGIAVSTSDLELYQTDIFYEFEVFAARGGVADKRGRRAAYRQGRA